eukprot:jgi/Botrbrau1/18637/Bobra.0367s0073.1
MEFKSHGISFIGDSDPHQHAHVSRKPLLRLRPCNVVGPRHRKAAAPQRLRPEAVDGSRSDTDSSTIYLSDLIPFESGTRSSDPRAPSEEKEEQAQRLVAEATAALRAARAALNSTRERQPARPPTSFTFPKTRRDPREEGRGQEDLAQQDATRAALEQALAAASWAPEEGEGYESDGDTNQSGAGGSNGAPRWAEKIWGTSRETGVPEWAPEAKLAQAAGSPQAELAFAEPDLATASLTFISQEAQDLQKAKAVVLPPFQSVLDLTSAVLMPQRDQAPAVTPSPASQPGREMENGTYVLPDGTLYERDSGEEFGPNGYWYRWTRLRGVSGKVEWEERWWEASDWAGYKEMGAEKSACNSSGEAWRETWRELISVDGDTGEPTVERSAHKWAHQVSGDEWEEKWGEKYWSMGRANKYADKWGKEGINVWHERWGEDYDGAGGCVKWTDKWAERLLEGGRREQWGDKWTEQFKDGCGSKNGEVWSEGGDGGRYQRWWGEDHQGNGWVRRHGHSTTGEWWDQPEQMDTYYNPIPHFDFRLAMGHSPTLRRLPTLPKGGNELGEGIDAL